MAKVRIQDLLDAIAKRAGVELDAEAGLADIEKALASISKTRGPSIERWSPQITTDGLVLLAGTGIRFAKDEAAELEQVITSKEFKAWFEAEFDVLKTREECIAWRKERHESNKAKK